jgi:hypothetical protein
VHIKVLKIRLEFKPTFKESCRSFFSSIARLRIQLSKTDCRSLGEAITKIKYESLGESENR